MWCLPAGDTVRVQAEAQVNLLARNLCVAQDCRLKEYNGIWMWIVSKVLKEKYLDHRVLYVWVRPAPVGDSGDNDTHDFVEASESRAGRVPTWSQEKLIMSAR
jgi:hypothetical protein